MKRAILVLAVLLAGCSLPGAHGAVAAPINSHCADKVAAAVTQTPEKNVIACLDAGAKKDLGNIKTDADFYNWLLSAYINYEFGGGQHGFPPFVMVKGCGSYSASALDSYYRVTFFKTDGDALIYGYEAQVDPAFSIEPGNSLLMFGVDSHSLVRTFAFSIHARDVCPAGHTGPVSSAR